MTYDPPTPVVLLSSTALASPCTRTHASVLCYALHSARVDLSTDTDYFSFVRPIRLSTLLQRIGQ